MAVGAGKYDDLCTLVREQTGAAGAIVAVLGGVKGNGFSVQGPAAMTAELPALLRQIAEQIDRDLGRYTAARRAGTIHVLRNGYAICGKMGFPPSTWGPSEWWVGFSEVKAAANRQDLLGDGQAYCDDCLAALGLADLKP